MELLFFLVKNFAWILIGFLLVRGPVRELATAAAGSAPPSRTARFGRVLRLLAGLYCIGVSFWNLGYSLLLHFRAR